MFVLHRKKILTDSSQSQFRVRLKSKMLKILFIPLLIGAFSWTQCQKQDDKISKRSTESLEIQCGVSAASGSVSIMKNVQNEFPW